MSQKLHNFFVSWTSNHHSPIGIRFLYTASGRDTVV